MARKGLYRIVDIAILIKMFKEKKNYLSSPKNWPDQWENLDLDLPKQKDTDLFQKIRGKVFAQCWSKEAYSWALWKMNSTNGYGVRIKTQSGDLYNGLPDMFRKKYSEDHAIQEVTYLTEEGIEKKIKEFIDANGMNWKTAFGMYFLKRRAFEYEKEVRLIVPKLAWLQGFERETLGQRSFITYPCDPNSYIESIYFDSKMDPYLYDVFKGIIRDFKFKGLIDKSAIDKEPPKIKFK
jgi:hypothetical protein